MEKGEYMSRSSQLPKAEKLVRARIKCLKEAELLAAALERTPDNNYIAKKASKLASSS